MKIVAPTDVGDAPVLYANHVQATATPEDVTLHLGWYALPPFTEPPPEPEVRVPVKPIAKVTVPLNIVQGIVTVLENQLKAYEQSYGQAVPKHPNPPAAAGEQPAEGGP